MKEGLRSFLIEANKAGYASGKERKWIKEPDGSTTIPFESGEWRMHDNFFGGEPYGGRIIVTENGKPYWMTAYYGSIVPEYPDVKGLYIFLQKALSQPPEEMPVRGPRRFEEGDLVYLSDWEGDLEKFEVTEKIKKAGNPIYEAKFIGGLVDQRGE